ncbi:hypothetical protein LSAT2_000684 [Lamellibrachia satsuma]|nr:hypothetical protein LSAT2_000684 [Lamellibrachia satsuma]
MLLRDQSGLQVHADWLGVEELQQLREAHLFSSDTVITDKLARTHHSVNISTHIIEGSWDNVQAGWTKCSPKAEQKC